MIQQELLRGHLEGLVLAVLADGPFHGYAIMEALKERSGGAVAIEGGTLYPLLHRLEEARLLKSAWSTAGGRRRRTYSLTAKGKRALSEKQSAWREFASVIEAVMSKRAPGTAN